MSEGKQKSAGRGSLLRTPHVSTATSKPTRKISTVRPVTAGPSSSEKKSNGTKSNHGKDSISLDMPRPSKSAKPRIRAPSISEKSNSESDVMSRRLSTTAPTESNARHRFSMGASAICAMIRFRNAALPRRSSRDTRSSFEQRNMVRLENTYRMEPTEKQHFKFPLAQELVDDAMQQFLKGYSYNERTAPMIAQGVSNEIMKSVKSAQWPRHRLICHVMVGEIKGQDLRSTSRCLWNPQTDNHVTASFKNSEYFVIATVHAVYLD